MNRTLRLGTLVLLLLLAAILSGAAVRRDPGRPNLLLILADDLGYGDLGFTGATDIETPHLDRLAMEGMRATNFYANAPVCSPSRASILTGRWPHRHGVQDVIYARDRGGLPASEVTVAELLRREGYATALIGKWHLGKESPSRPQDHGFETFVGLLGGSHDYFTHRAAERLDFWRGTEPWHVEGYTTELLTQEAVSYLRQVATREEPFFLYLAYTAPHAPLQAPEPLIQRYAHRIPRRERQVYAAMVTALDEGIGRVLATIDDLGLRRHTLVLFLSDNGGYLATGASNAPWNGDKGDLLEGGIHVPFVARWPGRIPAASRTDALACGADLFPTLLRAASVPLPTDRVIDGRDLLPVLTRRTDRAREMVAFRYQRERALRMGDWKLLGRYDEPPALFDLPVDRGERTDVASLYPAVVRELQARWEAFYGSAWSAHVPVRTGPLSMRRRPADRPLAGHAQPARRPLPPPARAHPPGRGATDGRR